MKKYMGLLCAFLFCLSSSFEISEACEYAGSNIGFVKSQTQKALEMEDINLARFHAYKALNAIVKSKRQLSDCGCNQATTSIEEGFYNLKMATRATSLSATKILLDRALEDTSESLNALLDPETCGGLYANDVLEMNTIQGRKGSGTKLESNTDVSKQKIDRSLVEYSKSMDKVINSVDCKEARNFAQRIHDHCEQQLLRPNLSELKKYYNLRTQEITAEALKRLASCNQ